MKAIQRSLIAVGIAAAFANNAQAFIFQTDSVQGSLDTQLTVGMGKRVQGQDCGLVGDRNVCGAAANTAQWANADNGDLNYNKGDLFTTHLKGTHELLLKFPDEWKFMARGTWLVDFKATDTARSELESDAVKQISRDTRLLDFWVSKEISFEGGKKLRTRLGQQAINWGESLFTTGGINATNALDLQKLAIPGTQLKEAVLPAPMLSLAASLGRGVNVEGYYQFQWQQNRYPPAGTYFSVTDIYDKGREPIAYFDQSNFNLSGPDSISKKPGVRNLLAIQQARQALISAGGDAQSFPFTVNANDGKPKKDGQYGLSLHYKPDQLQADFGFYYVNYHDKSPNLTITPTEYKWSYLENRKLYGVSTNFPLGDWSIGSELSYRPKDAVALSGCFNSTGPLDFNTNGAPVSCDQWIDEKKYQFILTAQRQLTPSDSGELLSMLGGATTAYLTLEAVGIRYPGVSPYKRYVRTVGGQQVVQVPAAGLLAWLDPNKLTGSGGTANSWGITADFNWIYDNSVIEGFQVIPGITYFQAIKGDTPNFTANLLENVKYANFYVLFNQNIGKWQAGVNYSTWFGSDTLRNVYKDRDFVGGFLTRSF